MRLIIYSVFNAINGDINWLSTPTWLMLPSKVALYPLRDDGRTVAVICLHVSLSLAVDNGVVKMRRFPASQPHRVRISRDKHHIHAQDPPALQYRFSSFVVGIQLLAIGFQSSGDACSWPIK